MRIILLFLFLFVNSFLAHAQDKTIVQPNQFIVLYTTGENWDTTKQAYEQIHFKEHSAHLSELRKVGKIKLGGRYSDTGMIVLQVESESEAHEIITKDIAIQNKLFTAQIFPFSSFYKGCVD